MFAFEVPRRLLNEVAAKHRLEPRGLSPIPRIDQRFPLPSGLSDPMSPRDLGDLKEAEVERVASILWNADRVVRLRHGGNWLAPEQREFFGITGAPGWLAGITPTTRETVIVQVLESAADFGSWVAETLNPSGLVQARDTIVSRVLTRDELIHLLHAADMFRRIHYQSQLDYLPLSEPRFALGDYTTALTSALCSQDYRSLLPCLLMMTPSVFPVGFEKPQRSFEMLMEQQIIQEDKGGYVFTPTGSAWTGELLTGWLAAAGIECAVVGADGTRVLPVSLFAAVTATGLHAFLIDQRTTPGAVTCSLPSVQAFAKLAADLVTDGEAASTEALRKFQQRQHRPPKTPIATVAAAFCAACGASVAPGAKFCPGCGKPVGPAALHPNENCPACGRHFHPGEKFCAGCGHRLS